MNIHVANLPPQITDGELQAYFAPFGIVEGAEVIRDIHTGKSVGYGFVIMQSEEEANKAISELNGKPWMEKALVVSKAKHQKWVPKRRGHAFQRNSNEEESPDAA